MYFIFKHVELSRYKDKKGKWYHYDPRSPNYKLVREGSIALCYQKEENHIYAIAKVGRIEERGGEFFAHYKWWTALEEPLFLSSELMKKLKIRDLRRRTPGIIPISKDAYDEIVKRIVKANPYLKEKLEDEGRNEEDD